MRQTFSLICLLSWEVTIDHPSGRGIQSKEFSNVKSIKTYLSSSIQEEHLHFLAIMSIESEVSRDLNLDKFWRTLLVLNHEK